MNQESWHAVTPQYSHYDDVISQFESLPHVSFLDVQPRLKQALSTFAEIKGFSRILVINSPDNAFYRTSIKNGLSSLSNSPIISSESININELLGTYSCNKLGEIVSQKQGLLEKANGGYLVVSANILLANPSSWLMLKSVFLGEQVSPVNVTPSNIANECPISAYNIKLVVVGNRDQIADLEYLDGELYNGLASYTEIEHEITLSEQSIRPYLGYLSSLLKEYGLPSLSAASIHRLMVAGARYTEDQRYMPIEPLWYLSLFQEASLYSDGQQISESALDKAIEAKFQRESYLPERALSDILDGQVIIETQGECIGQVNGLTVIDVSGHPLPYGEPARISCVIHFGDGDISDVERKAELGGNLHAKGMMIMQAFVSSALQLDEPLPYSASVVFEQSYCEVDGDSATLAELCSFVSALSEYPINQQIAVTGAVDQFGRVQAVGGLNEKIEGFYHVCKHQGLTGQQGVILPKTNLKHLALHKDVVESIKNDEFHIWSVETVDEAIPIIMGKPFRGDDETSVIHKIAERIDNYEKHEHPQGIVERIKNWFS
ncbi:MULTISPECIES: S16 family serine protease [Vibrio]|uniref:S16 family serine protease n=1 Tax=Vibrio TaxID=662 RepID=UPI0020765708|nr:MULTISPECIES: Lon protease family protein [Vibrio]USD33933.1 Lon protease family protein [Vibrio sp. SCSIO 43186]USD47035.1 Lon protease family protein [Vibrio sp. SCSIO 43145]USD71057.1 Lon protease family protein [Vibrio sp. SCSIO 43139]USD95962.1 ATP-dependent protease [Vibrio coralliilyticus]